MPKKPPKPKPVNYSCIVFSDSVTSPYRVLEEARNKWHDDLHGATIYLAWRKNLKPDTDGHLMLGRCIKISDREKEFHKADFVIVLNREVWQEPSFTQDKKLALIDHELCHAAVALDKDLERKTDEKGRTVWRTVKHDIEEFRAVVKRHGCYKADLVKFAEALLERKQDHPMPLQFPEHEKTARISEQPN